MFFSPPLAGIAYWAREEWVNMRNVRYVEYARYAGYAVRPNFPLALKDMTLAVASCYPLLVSVQQ